LRGKGTRRQEEVDKTLRQERKKKRRNIRVSGEGDNLRAREKRES
jgi:hypothetical protein